jgi:hypothetical protein
MGKHALIEGSLSNAWHAWVPTVMSYHAGHQMALLPKDLAPMVLSGTGMTPGCDCWGPGCMPSWVMG